MTTTWNNIPVAYVDPNFSGQLDQLKEQNRRIYIASLAGNDSNGSLCGTTAANQRKWQMPKANGWDLNIFNIRGISSAFDRVTANDVYIRALTKGPKVGALDIAPEGEGRASDCMAMKIQIDYLSVQERAFRLRHASSIRCAMHAATRRRGHSTWNDATGLAAYLTSLGADAVPTGSDVAGPVGGIFTTLIRYLYLTIKGGYNEGSVETSRPTVDFTVLPDATVIANADTEDLGSITI